MFNLQVREEDNDPNFYDYRPSLPAAIIFLILFLTTTGHHIFQAAKKRTFYFIPLIIGGVFEVAGYTGRALGNNNPNSLPLFLMQAVTLLVAPALFAASIYMILGRIILLTQAESMSPIRAKWLTKIFVCGDVLSFLVQAGGGGLLSDTKSQDMGKTLILIGLAVQIIFFTFFIYCAGIFHYRLLRSPTSASMQSSWAKHIYTLYGTGILILIRSIFRVAEFAAGPESSLQTKEAYIYIFDAVLMVGVMVWFNIVHPGSIIGRKVQGGDHFPLSDREEESLSYGRR
ncbi:RTA1 like protein-domain-containing protein [Bisporella sp. PMI_857]|nr:RTA1 like protein-domain-containing protein [Bisporella sp. PMI_857]